MLIKEGERCERHKRRAEFKRIYAPRAPKMRGDSRWQREQGMFDGKAE